MTSSDNLDAFEFEAPLLVFKGQLYSYQVKVPQPAVDRFTEGNDRRVRVLYNGSIEHPCAIMPHPNGHYLMINKSIRSKLGMSEGDTVHVQMVKERSKYGTPMPEEFQACLEADPQGWEYFESQTPGNKRSLIHLVSKIKSSEKRITKSLAILHHLNEVEGKLDYKRLNQTIKEFNQRSNLR